VITWKKAPVDKDKTADNDKKKDKDETSDKDKTGDKDNGTTKTDNDTTTKENNNQRHSTRDAAIIAGTWITITKWGYKWLEKIKNAAEKERTVSEADVEKVKTQMGDIKTELNQKSVNGHFTSKMQNNFKESAADFQETINNLDKNTLSAVQDWGRLGNILPNDALKNLDISSELAKQLQSLDETTIKEISTMKDTDAIKTLLKSKWVTESIPTDLLKYLAKGENKTVVSMMLNVFGQSKWLNLVMKWFKMFWVIDLIFIGLSVKWMEDEKNEADIIAKTNKLRAENKYNLADFKMWNNIISLLAMNVACEATTTLLAGAEAWSIGWPIGMAVGLIVAAAFQWVEAGAEKYYYNVVDFFAQNKEDYIKQSKTEIKEAILQTTHSLVYGNVSLGEKLTSTLSDKVDANQKMTTLKDAREGLIYIEEFDEKDEKTGTRKFPTLIQYKMSGKKENEFLKLLTTEQKAEYTKENTAMNVVIASRMEYITKEHQKEKIKTAMQTSQWLYYISKILAESKGYATMKAEGKWKDTLDFEANKKGYRETLKTSLSVDEKKFTVLDTLYAKNPNKFWELYKWAEFYKPTIEQVQSTDPDYIQCQTVLKNIELIEQYYAYLSFGVPDESSINIGEYSFDFIDYKYLHRWLLNMDDKNAKTMVLNTEQTKQLFLQNNYRKSADENLEVSDITSQNVLYQLAKQIYGYTGKNDKKSLITYFSKDKKDMNGLYYDEKWHIQASMGHNLPFSFDDVDTIQDLTDANIDTKVKTIIDNRFYEDITTTSDPMSGNSTTTHQRKPFIETKVWNVDNELMNEIESKFTKIIKQELTYKILTNKKKTETDVIMYIKTHSLQVPITTTENEKWETVESKEKEQWYIEIPYYLIIEAKKAWIGNLEGYVFKYKDNAIIACALKSNIDEPFHFSQTQTNITKEYVEGDTKLPENAQKYIDYVDVAKTKFENLIDFNNNDLNISAEYLKTYREKINAWEKFRLSLLSLDPAVAKSQLDTKYQEYHDYFENTYIGLLMKISKFSRTNNLNDVQYLKEVDMYTAQLKDITIEKGVIKWAEESFSENQKKIFIAALGRYKIDGKDIPTLAKSSEDADKKKAIWAVKQIVKSVLEAQVMGFDTQGNISSIVHWERKWFEYKRLFKKEERNRLEQIEKVVDARVAINADIKAYFDESSVKIDTKAVDANKVKIKPVSKENETTIITTNEVQKTIEKTNSTDKIWLGRWSIKFDPETNLLTSWDKTTKIDATKLMIDGLTTRFSTLEELVMTANLMNRFKEKYPWVKDFYFGSRMRSWIDYGIYRSKSWVDTKVLSIDTIKKIYPSILDSNNDVKPEIIAYINSIT